MCVCVCLCVSVYVLVEDWSWFSNWKHPLCLSVSVSCVHLVASTCCTYLRISLLQRCKVWGSVWGKKGQTCCGGAWDTVKSWVYDQLPETPTFLTLQLETQHFTIYILQAFSLQAKMHMWRLSCNCSQTWQNSPNSHYRQYTAGSCSVFWRVLLLFRQFIWKKKKKTSKTHHLIKTHLIVSKRQMSQHTKQWLVFVVLSQYHLVGHQWRGTLWKTPCLLMHSSALRGSPTCQLPTSIQQPFLWMMLCPL